MIRYTFFIFPIYKHTRKIFYEEEKVFLEKKKNLMENDPYWKNTSTASKEKYLKNFRYPTWEFNDIVGFLKIGMDGETSMIGKIYLKGKYFPKNYKINNGNRYKTALQKEHCIEYSDTKLRVHRNDNYGYLETFNKLIEEAENKISPKQWFLAVPDFSFQCFDFVQAYKQLKK